MREYLTPDFDVTIYEVEDIITASGMEINPSDPDDNGSGDPWWG